VARTGKAVLGILAIVLIGGAVWLRWGRTPPPIGNAPPRAVRGGELVVALRGEPAAYNRYVEATTYTEVLTTLVHSRLVRINRATDELEPWLAESWTQSPDGLTYTIKLRRDVKFSDGTPFTSADVLFSFRALYDGRVKSPLASGIAISGRPLTATAPDPATLVITFPTPFAPGLRVLDNLPILPRHKLESALDRGQFPQAWTPTKPLSDIAGLGPFVLTEHVAGQRMVFVRNPHYWRFDEAGVQLPYLDRITVVVIPEQTTEALRLEAGEVDLAANADIRPEDYVRFKQRADRGEFRLVDVGVGLDPNYLWFNLTGAAPAASKPWMARREFRQAVSFAVDRSAMVNTVHLGLAEPIFGPVTPGNRKWFSADVPSYPYDLARARQLLAGIGLADRNGDGTLEDEQARPVRFSILTQRGHTVRERGAAVLQEHLRRTGIGVDVVALDTGGIIQRWSKSDYDSIYFGWQASSTDPALNPDLWFSGGSFHVWNPRQPQPATDWERRTDELMRKQMVSPDVAERQRLFAEVQRIWGEELPVLCFVAPRVVVAHSVRVLNVAPALQVPQLLWNPDVLAVTGPRRSATE
jgi:peptide/nickel transport system substrate-binding protein